MKKKKETLYLVELKTNAYQNPCIVNRERIVFSTPGLIVCKISRKNYESYNLPDCYIYPFKSFQNLISKEDLKQKFCEKKIIVRYIIVSKSEYSFLKETIKELKFHDEEAAIKETINTLKRYRTGCVFRMQVKQREVMSLSEEIQEYDRKISYLQKNLEKLKNN